MKRALPSKALEAKTTAEEGTKTMELQNLNVSAPGANLTEVARALGTLQNTVNQLNRKTDRMESKMSGLDKSMEKIRNDLGELTQEFQKLVTDQRKSALLQKAITELVRVRQEISQKYGNHSVVRETMLGVLQASDLALVKKTTISQVSEELMLSTPKYWLAPCLVAVSAWISNDKSLAERAIREAMKRDEEKTSLAMALICRRNGRIDTGYEWLANYFAKQSAQSITEETFTYIDAYVNGVFGPDEKHRCRGFVSKWIDEVRGNNSSFEESQEEKWKNYCRGFRKDLKKDYPDLAENSKEFEHINTTLGAIGSFLSIKDKFKGISDAFIDQETLKKTVDAELVRLVSHYDSSEIEIRDEEEYLTYVRQFDGDEEKAKTLMELRKLKRTQHKLDFIEQMSREITTEEATAPSKRKTAVTFLSGYINRGYDKYIAESRESFPGKVTVQVGNWNGKSASGKEFDTLAAEFEQHMVQARDREIERVKTTKPRLLLIFSILMLVPAIASIFIQPLLAPVFLAAGLVLLFVRFRSQKTIDQTISGIHKEYDEKIGAGKNKIQAVLEQWLKARSLVDDYEKESDHLVA